MAEETPVLPAGGEQPAPAEEPAATEPGAGGGDDGTRIKAARRARRIERYVIPGLAVVLALAVGALVIVFSDPDLLS